MSDYKITTLKKIVVITTGLLSAALLARYLGSELRAEYAVIANAAAILVVLLNFGVSNSYQPARRQKGYQVVQVFSLYALFLFIALCCVALLATGLLGDEYTAVLVITSVSLLRMQLQSFCLVESIYGAAWSSILGGLAEVVVVFMLWLFFPSVLVYGLLAVLIKDVIIAMMSLYFICDNYQVQMRAEGKKERFFRGNWCLVIQQQKKSFFTYFPFFLLTVLIGVNYKVDVLLLDGLGVEKQQIGIFAVGVLVAEYLWIFADIFKDVQVSRTARGGGSKDVAFANRAAIAVTLFVYFIFLLLGQVAISFFFGAEYSASYEVAALMLIANIFMVPCKIIGAYYISLNRVKIYLISMLLAVVINVGLNLLLIPLYGLHGAIFASIASYFLAGAFIIIDFLRLAGVGLGETLIIKAFEIKLLARNILGKAGWF
jgi:O-antigen/teichoic acid export membrane protein